VARFDWHDNQFPPIRKSPGMVAHLKGMGEQWTAELNAELHSAQAARNQPVEDGYTAHITTGGSRARLFIVAASARAQAHEAKHSSILKLMRTSGHDVDVNTGREFKNPTKGWRVHGVDDQGAPIHGLD
jgi:hypothetical protein